VRDHALPALAARRLLVLSLAATVISGITAGRALAAVQNDIDFTNASATCDPGSIVTFSYSYGIAPGEDRTDHWELRNPAGNSTNETVTGLNGDDGRTGDANFQMTIPTGTNSGDTMTVTVVMESTIGQGGTITFRYDCSTGDQISPPVVDSLSSRALAVAVGTTSPYTERVSWDGHVPGKGGADIKYEVATRDPGSSTYKVRYTGSSTSRDITLKQGYSRIRVVAIHDGVRGASRSIGVNRRVVNIKPMSPAGTIWRRSTDSASVGRDVLWASRVGGKARFTLPSAKGYALFARTSSSSGTVEVWVDGKKVATRSLKSSSTVRRKLVWSKSYSSTRTRRIEIRLVSGRASLDAFLITK
jgi:hypothetical protein